MDSSSIKNEFLREIDKLVDQNVQANDDCVSVYDLYQVMKNISFQKEKEKQKFIKKLRDVLNVEHVDVFPYTLDVYPFSNNLKIEVNRLVVKRFSEHSEPYLVRKYWEVIFSKDKNWHLKSGCVWDDEREFDDRQLGYDILDNMGDYLTAFLNNYFELSNSSFFNVFSLNSNFNIKIKNQKIYIIYKGTIFDTNDMSNIETLKKILVRIDDCPIVIQREIYRMKKEQLEKLKKQELEKFEESEKKEISIFNKLKIKLNIINKNKIKTLTEKEKIEEEYSKEEQELREVLEKKEQKLQEQFDEEENERITKRIEEELKEYNIIENNTLSENVPIKAFAYYNVSGSMSGRKEIFVKKKGYWVRILYHDVEFWSDSDCVDHFDDICDATYELTDEEIKCIKNFISEDEAALLVFSDYLDNKGKSYNHFTADRSHFEPAKCK